MSMQDGAARPDLALMGRLQASIRFELNQKRPESALPHAEEFVAHAQRTCLPGQPLSLVLAYRLLAEVKLALGDNLHARLNLEYAMSALRESKQERGYEETAIREMLARAQAREGKSEAGLATMTEVARFQLHSLGPEHPDYRGTMEACRRLGILVLLKQGRLEEAEARAVEWVEDCNRTCSAHDATSLPQAYLMRAHVAHTQGCLGIMEQFASRALKMLKETGQDRSIPGLNARQMILCYWANAIAKRCPIPYEFHLDEKVRSYQDLQALVLELQRELLGNRHPACSQTLRRSLQHSRALNLPVEDSPRFLMAIAPKLDSMPLLDPTHSPFQPADSPSTPEGNTAELERLNWILAKIEALEPTVKGPARTIPDPHLGRIRRSLEELRSEAAEKCAAGLLEEAFELLAQACSQCDSLMARQVFALPSRAQWLKTLAFVKELQADLLTVLAALGFSGSVLRETALDLILHSKCLAAEPMLTQRLAILGGRYPELSTLRQRLELLRQHIVHKTLNGPDSGRSREDHEWQLRQWHLYRAGLEQNLALLIPEMNLEEQLRGVSSFQVSKELPADAVLIEFIRYRPTSIVSAVTNPKARYLAFVLQRAEPERVSTVDLGDAADLDELIRSFRRSLAPVSPSQGRPLVLVADADEPPHRPSAVSVEANGPGTHLYQRLFVSLQPYLGTATRLFLAPDGDLALVPFEVLPADRGEWLIDRYQISYVATGRNLLRFAQQARGSTRTSVVAANPDFDLAEEWNSGMTLELLREPAQACFASLDACRPPGTADEGRRIAQRLGVHPLLGREVDKRRILTLRSPHILHLATHGFFVEPRRQASQADPDDLPSPLIYSGLVLAGFNTWCKGGLTPRSAGNGLLTAEEVLGIDLHNTELVVLSACETGIGNVDPGEGVLGLRWAFVVAGARTLVMSLWKVPDLATAVLMDRFYHNLLDKRLPRDQALREAQQYLRRCTIGQLRQDGWLRNELGLSLADLPDSGRPFADPYYWGAFICQGDPSPLPEAVSPWAATSPGPAAGGPEKRA